MADCGGGARTCATWHGYVESEWIDRIPPATHDELDMIGAGCLHAQPNSRLMCQIKVIEALDGLTIPLPPQS